MSRHAIPACSAGAVLLCPNQQLKGQGPFYDVSILQSSSGSCFFCCCSEVLFMRTSACSWRLTCQPKRRKYSWGLETPRLVLLYKRN